MRPDPNKVDAINKIATPRTFKQLRSFLGMVNYYTRFIPKLNSLMIPLYNAYPKMSYGRDDKIINKATRI